jgi:hypothetical protein
MTCGTSVEAVFAEGAKGDARGLVVAGKGVLLISEISIASIDAPAANICPDDGTSSKAFADFILRRRLLACCPVLSAT